MPMAVNKANIRPFCLAADTAVLQSNLYSYSAVQLSLERQLLSRLMINTYYIINYKSMNVVYQDRCKVDC